MLRKVHPKQVWHPPSASDYNAMAMAAESYLAGPDGQPVREQPINPCILQVKNSSGTARRQGDILQLGSSLVTTLDAEHLWLDGVAPAAPLWTSYHGVVLQQAPVNAIVPLQVSGVCLAWVNVTDSTHRRCDVDAASYVLQSKYAGPYHIVHPLTGTGETLCVVLLGPKRPSSGVAKLTADLAAGSTSVHASAAGALQKPSGGAWASAGQSITIYSWFATAFSTDDFLAVTQHDDGLWWLETTDCL